MQNNTYTTTSLALRIEEATPTPERRRVARDAGLAASLSSGHYPVFLGMHGPSQDLNLKDSSLFDFLSLLWPASLCTLIAMETNRYACQKRAPSELARYWYF